MRLKILSAIILLLAGCSIAAAQTSVFTYQGKLSDNGAAANGNYDIQFKLFDTATVGTGVQQGQTITNATVSVTTGAFTVQLDFGAGAFSGPPRFLELGVRPAGNSNPYNVLAPRQQVTSTPYAVRSLNSSVADVLSSACVGCVTSTQIGSVSGSAVTGSIPVASVPAGSGNYLQNATTQQTASFNVSGDGTVRGTLSGAVVNAESSFTIGGSRVLGATGLNTFVGNGTGTNNNGNNNSNSFFGNVSGNQNTTGTLNSFFGADAGRSNTTGVENAFFGYFAGRANTASFNSFFGSRAGDSNVAGGANAFFGYNAGTANISGVNNAFFGYQSGPANTASNNSFVGSQAGSVTTSGGFNTFVGTFAGNSNTTGNHNTIIGEAADVDTNNLTYATAIGAGAVVSNSNTLVLGRDLDTVKIPGTLIGPGLGLQIEGHLNVSGRIAFDLTNAADGNVCWNTGYHYLGFCSSSLRYKTNVQNFTGGLNVVRKLRPITFNWIDGGKADVGFGAEEVGQVEPLLATRNTKGEIQGVKYGQISAVLVNAVNEQQAQIAEQQRTIAQQRQQLKLQQVLLLQLKRLVCSRSRNAEVCK